MTKGVTERPGSARRSMVPNQSLQPTCYRMIVRTLMKMEICSMVQAVKARLARG